MSSQAETKFAYEIWTCLFWFLYLWYQIEQKNTCAFQKTTVFAFENIKKKLIQILEYIWLLISLFFYLLLQHRLLNQQLPNSKRRQNSSTKLMIVVLYNLAHKKKITQLI